MPEHGRDYPDKGRASQRLVGPGSAPHQAILAMMEHHGRILDQAGDPSGRGDRGD